MDRPSDNPTAATARPPSLEAAAAARCARTGVVGSLAVHIVGVALAIALASTVELRIANFGNARPLSIVAAFTEYADPAVAPEVGGSQQIVITPTEAWQDDRHFVNTTVLPSVDRAADLPSRAAPRPSLDQSASVRPTDSPPPRFSRRTPTVPRRRASASVEPSIAPVALPPPDIRFVGRPCRYPAVALEAGWEGKVVLLIAIDADGAVTSVAIDRPSGNAAVDAEAVQTARRWRAVPNKDGGKLWPGQVRKPIHFRLQ